MWDIMLLIVFIALLGVLIYLLFLLLQALVQLLGSIFSSRKQEKDKDNVSSNNK